MQSDDTNNANLAAVAAIKAKAATLMARHEAISLQRHALFQELRQIDHALVDCQAAARLFDLDLPLPGDLVGSAQKRASEQPQGLLRRRLGQASLFAEGSVAKAAVVTSAPPAPITEEPTIRDLVASELQRAGAAGTRAGPLRSFVEKALGRQIHYKTIGMTLYRLSKDEPPQARREGVIWYFVPPPSAETKTPGA